jgi:hypothetical protein
MKVPHGRRSLTTRGPRAPPEASHADRIGQIEQVQVIPTSRPRGSRLTMPIRGRDFREARSSAVLWSAAWFRPAFSTLVRTHGP